MFGIGSHRAGLALWFVCMFGLHAHVQASGLALGVVCMFVLEAHVQASAKVCVCLGLGHMCRLGLGVCVYV